MTDIEISKALALAIGWNGNCIRFLYGAVHCYGKYTGYRKFDYLDWNVIGPIAERYNCFPKKMINEWAVLRYDQSTYAETPQKAIALAVIGAKK